MPLSVISLGAERRRLTSWSHFDRWSAATQMNPIAVPDTTKARVGGDDDLMLDRNWFGDESRVSPEPGAGYQGRTNRGTTGRGSQYAV